MNNTLDIGHLREWIGKTETASETISEQLVARYRATFGQWLAPCAAETAPLGLHWCLTLPLADSENLGPDGHPARGGFLPPVALPSRMWAGGEVRLLATIPATATVTRHSVISDVILKSGRSGRLVFVTVEHDYSADGHVAISETQNIVYRDSALRPSPASPEEDPAEMTGVQMRLTPDPVLLFRYSAMTFNGHRIHYDQPYACGTEGYPGLVVHGPLQATLLLNLAARIGGGMPVRFTYRGLSPLFVQTPLALHHSGAAAEGKVWSCTDAGTKTMQGNYTI